MADLLLNPKDTFTFPPGETGKRSPKIVEIDTAFDGSVAFDVRHTVAPSESVNSATAAISPSGPTLGTVAYANDKQTITVPLNTVSIGEYVLTVTVTSTDGSIYAKEGLIVVD